MPALGRHPTSPFACRSERCFSPLACASFGYCRGLNHEPAYRPLCVGCLRHPDEIPDLKAAADAADMAPDAYVLAEEGTLNPDNKHFLCDECFIKAGKPASPSGWVAP